MKSSRTAKDRITVPGYRQEDEGSHSMASLLFCPQLAVPPAAEAVLVVGTTAAGASPCQMPVCLPIFFPPGQGRMPGFGPHTFQRIVPHTRLKWKHNSEPSVDGICFFKSNKSFWPYLLLHLLFPTASR